MTKERLIEVLFVISIAYFGWLGVQVVSIKSELSVVAHQTEQMWGKYLGDIAFTNVIPNLAVRE
tara:strand:- start:452 stop:643 length:192 start_codon:yes stop_codon:yes gene_type:complete